MRRRLVWIIVVIAAVGLAIAVRSVTKADRQKTRAAADRSALLRYSQNFRLGLTRKDVEDGLRSQHTNFIEQCCYEDRGAFAVLVKVGDEDVPWYCSEWPVYVVFEFRATLPPELLSLPSGSDVLRSVHLASKGGRMLVAGAAITTSRPHTTPEVRELNFR